MLLVYQQRFVLLEKLCKDYGNLIPPLGADYGLRYFTVELTKLQAR